MRTASDRSRKIPSTPQDLLIAWSRLGIAFAVEPKKASVTKDAPDPEFTLIRSLEFFQSDRKLLSLVVLWLKEYGNYLNIEKLKSIAQKNADSLSLAWLGGTFLKVRKSDKRFNIFVKWIERELPSPRPHYPSDPSEKRLIELKGKDSDFERMGLSILPLFEENFRKLRPKDFILEHHPVLRARAIFGVNYRADFFYFLSSDSPPKTAYSLMKRLHCSYQTAHSLWGSLRGVNIDSKMLKRFVTGN